MSDEPAIDNVPFGPPSPVPADWSVAGENASDAMSMLKAAATGAAQQPSVGRIVHYVSHGTPMRPDGSQAYTPECRAAIVTGVLVIKDLEIPSSRVATTVTDKCSLAVLNPTGMFFNERVEHDEDEKRGGTWHWPERVG